MDPITATLQIIILLFSVVIHEVTHGAVALALGDTTARDSGRLTLNPLKHLDPFGSLLLPFLLITLGSGIIFGWAKPVPYNPFRFRDPRRGAAIVGLAGPAANLVLAVTFAFALRLMGAYDLFGLAGEFLATAFLSIVIINLFLAFFNLIPIPPLDGSKLLFLFIPDRYYGFKVMLERYGLFLFLFVILFVSRTVGPLVGIALDFLVGPEKLFGL